MKIQKRLRCSTISVFLLFGFTAHSALAGIFLVDPTSSFRIVAQYDVPAPPTLVNLSVQGLNEGDTLEFQVADDTFYYQDPGCDGVDPNNRTPGPVTAVFSATATVLDPGYLHRVPDAIDAGEDVNTNPASDGTATNIDEDFRVEAGTTVVVPQLANFLILSSLDSWYKDNCVPSNINEDNLRGYIEVTIEKSDKIIVDIDVKPGSYPNCFNNNGHGVIPIAILGSEQFVVTQVVYEELSFGGMAVRVRGKKGPLCHLEDSNSDGYTDLVCQFEDDAVYWEPGDSEATLTGKLSDSGEFEGTDSICVVQ